MSHRRKLFIAIAVVMLALIGIWVVTMCIEPSDDVEVYKKSLMAKGEKLTIAELLPSPVPPKQNGADIVNAASRLLIPPEIDWSNRPQAMQLVAPGRAIIAFKQPDVRTDSFTNSWSIVLEAAEANRPGTDMLKQMLNFPSLDFHIDYDEDSMWPWQLSDSLPVQYCSYRLSATTICDLRKDDPASATTNLCVMLALVNGEHGERTPRLQYDRMDATEQAASATWELLQATHLNDAELSLLQTNWARLEFIEAGEKAYLMDRAATETDIAGFRTSTNYYSLMKRVWGGFNFSGGVKESLDDFWEDSENTYGLVMYESSWTYPDELQMLQGDQLVIETIRTIETNGFFNPAYSNMVNQLQANEPTNDPDSWIDKMDEKGLQRMFSEDAFGTGSINRVMAMEAAREIIITAIALKRYQLKYGDYPTNLDSLVPQFVATVPIDPVDGKRLRYRLNAGGTYLLYSIGQDSKDDGGDPSAGAGVTNRSFAWLNAHALDWVWPQPATVAEIEYFYAHPPK